MSASAGSLRVLLVLTACSVAHSHAYSAKGTAFVCGTLDLSSKLTRHCFPPKADRHAICCVDIQLPEPSLASQSSMGQNSTSYHNILESRIRSASQPESYSWCTCSVEVCEKHLGGSVGWILQADGSTLNPLEGAKFASETSITADSLSFGGGDRAKVGDATTMDVDHAGAAGGKMDIIAGAEGGKGLDAMIAERENEVMRLMATKEDDDDESAEVDLGEKLRPLSKEQMEELIAALIAKYDAKTGLGDDVLALARRPVDVSAVAYEIETLGASKVHVRDFAEALLPHADKALFYAQAGDVANCFAIAQALTSHLPDALPSRDPGGDLAPLWARLEGAWEEGLRRSKRRQRDGLRALLQRSRESLTDGHGPVFSDTIRLIDRLDKEAKAKRKGRFEGLRGDANTKEAFFKKHGVSKKDKEKRMSSKR